MEIIKCKNYDEMSKIGANVIISLLKRKPDAVLGLATGSTPIGLYKNVIIAYNNKEISFKDVRTYNLDEYCGIERNNIQSYYHFMNEKLFNYVDIKKTNINVPFARNEFVVEDCRKYNKEINRRIFDIQVLGIGNNGHIGFNEPGTPFNQETFVVDLAKETIVTNSRFFNRIEEVPTKAITMGIKNINNAKTILLLASGTSKAQAIYDLVNEEPNTMKPQTSLQNHSNLIVICDEEASSLL